MDNSLRPNPPMHYDNPPPRPNRWIPVEVWQSKGITAHEMTLPQGEFLINKKINKFV